MINASSRRRILGSFLLACAALGLFSLSQFGTALHLLPATFQLMLLPTIGAPLLGGSGLLLPHPPRAANLACGVFLATLALMTAWPLLQLPGLLSMGNYATLTNALTSILVTLFWLSQLTKIVFEPEPELNFNQLRLSLGLALSCSFLTSLWLARDVSGAWAFQLQATGSAFYGFTGWKAWNTLMAGLSLGLIGLGGALARHCLLLWCLGWPLGGLLLVTAPLQLGMSPLLMLAVALFPAALGGWLWAEQNEC